MFWRPDILLWIPVVVGLGTALALWAGRGRRRDLARLGLHPGSELASTSAAHGRTWRTAATLAVLALVLTAGARPRWGVKDTPWVHRGVDLVIAIDVSASMLAEDVPPSRLEAARAAAADLVRALPGVRVSIVGFAGAALVHCPITLDHDAVVAFVGALGPGSVPVGGSSISEALTLAGEVLDDDRQQRAVLVISDGEQHGGDAASAAARTLESGVRVYTLGVGTAAGHPVPSPGLDGRIAGYKRDADGRVVTSRLEEAGLIAIAESGGGSYHRSTAGRAELRVLSRRLRALSEGDRSIGALSALEERFQWPLAPAVVLLLAILGLPGPGSVGRRETKP